MTQLIFENINAMLAVRGMLLHVGTVVDATILAGPPSKKNRAKALDPVMFQTKKCNQGFFVMKAHLGVDAESGLVRTVGTAANVANVSEAEHLLHGDETLFFADAGYHGVERREALKDKPFDWLVAKKRNRIKTMVEGPLKVLLLTWGKLMAHFQAVVEQPSHVV